MNKYKKQKTEYREGVEWVIYSPSKKSIWGGGDRYSFLTLEDAKREYDKQMAKLTPEIRDNLDWRIEQRQWGTEIYTDSSTSDDEGFGAFD